MDLRTELLETAAAYCAATGKSKARVATIVVNDGKFFDRIERGGGFTVSTYERFMKHFAENPPASSPAESKLARAG